MNEQINDNILAIINKTPMSIAIDIAARIKARRLEKNWTQKLLAAKAGIAFSTYRRFEMTGEIAFTSLVKVAFALDLEYDFDNLFTKRIYSSIDEIVNDKNATKRKRGGKNE